MSDSHTGIEALETAMRQFFQAMKRPQRWEQLAAKAGVSLDRPAAAILQILALHGKTGTTVHGLAEALGVEAPSVTRKTQELEEAGLLTRERNQADKRVVFVYITSHGQKTVEKVRKAQRHEIQSLLAGWPKHDREQFITLFSRFAADVTKQSNA